MPYLLTSQEIISRAAHRHLFTALKENSLYNNRQREHLLITYFALRVRLSPKSTADESDQT